MRFLPLRVLTPIALLLLLTLLGCGSDDAAPRAAAAAAGGAGAAPAAQADDDAWPTDDDLDAGAGEGAAVNDQPAGDNPAFLEGPYPVKMMVVDLEDDDAFPSAYFFVPQGAKRETPYPTLVWGHGLLSAYFPYSQLELLRREASQGYLVVYPNIEITFPELPPNFTMKGVHTYLAAARKAVALGLADPERIVFGGYSMGARMAFLATAMTTGLDPLNIWPDPIACVYEALSDLIETDLWYPDPIPAPSLDVWAQYIDPEIPQTILMAADDQIVKRYDDEGAPINGQRLFELLRSEFAQLIVLSSGTTWRDRAMHQSFLAPTPELLDAFDWWGHLKIVAGLLNYHFSGGSRQWAYGFLRWSGGFDRAGQPIIHQVYERHNGVEDLELDGANNDSHKMRGAAR